MEKVVWSPEIGNILKTGNSLIEFGIDNWALNRLEALQALNKLHMLHISILGGDVYEKIEGTIRPNYDSWHCDRLVEESYDEFVNRSIQETKSYIEKYNIEDFEKIFFAFVPGMGV